MLSSVSLEISIGHWNIISVDTILFGGTKADRENMSTSRGAVDRHRRVVVSV